MKDTVVCLCLLDESSRIPDSLWHLYAGILYVVYLYYRHAPRFMLALQLIE